MLTVLLFLWGLSLSSISSSTQIHSSLMSSWWRSHRGNVGGVEKNYNYLHFLFYDSTLCLSLPSNSLPIYALSYNLPQQHSQPAIYSCFSNYLHNSKISLFSSSSSSPFFSSSGRRWECKTHSDVFLWIASHLSRASYIIQKVFLRKSFYLHERDGLKLVLWKPNKGDKQF